VPLRECHHQFDPRDAFQEEPRTILERQTHETDVDLAFAQGPDLLRRASLAVLQFRVGA
jgi:hypothetical protein